MDNPGHLRQRPLRRWTVDQTSVGKEQGKVFYTLPAPDFDRGSRKTIGDAAVPVEFANLALEVRRCDAGGDAPQFRQAGGCRRREWRECSDRPPWLSILTVQPRLNSPRASWPLKTIEPRREAVGEWFSAKDCDVLFAKFGKSVTLYLQNQKNHARLEVCASHKGSPGP